jgi:acetyltransferase-like isoleucine patch superfamily enzyme/GT2 family glycosyltransferase
MKYSVIIPSYNSETTIIPCLQAVFQQHFEDPYEVIVVDSSTDTTPEIIRQHFPQVKLIHLEERADTGAAKSIGIRNSEGDIICLLDSDCLADPDWLHNIAEAHQNEEYAAVGGAILNGNPEKFVGWAGYFAEFREQFPYQPRQLVRHIAGCNLSYKRRVFDRYGVFLSGWYPQSDLVFNLQLYKNRDKILFDPTIKVAHINKTSITHFFTHQYRIGRITSEVLKHYPFLPGGTIANSRMLTLLASPVLPIVKFLNTYQVATRTQEYKRRFLLIVPLLFFGLLLFWGSGFVRGVFLPRRFLRNTKPLGDEKHPIRWEIQRWALQGLSYIPGEIGAFLRKWLIPFRTRGDNIRLREHVWIECPENLTIGENCRINRGVYIQAVGGVDIGSNVGIGPGALIYSLNHNFREKHRLYMDQGYTAARVVIEDDVWIGAYAKILPGITVCQGTIVAAGAVVTKNTEPYSIVAGIPAKVIGYRQ